MNKQIEALKMAIEALEFQAFGKYRQEVVSKLKEALAEAEKREPVSLGDFDKLSKYECVEYIDYLRKEIDLLRFIEWQSLSDDEKKSIQNNSWIIHDDGSKEFNTFVFARAIEQALKEKNHG